MSSRSKRRRDRRTFIISVALDTLPVSLNDSEIWESVPLSDIEIVRPSNDGLVDVIYAVERDLPSGITVRETKSGESTIDQVMTALGWQAGMPHNGARIAVVATQASSA